MASFQSEDVKTSLESWFGTQLGKHLLAKQKQILEVVLPKLFGYHLLYTGLDIESALLESSPIKHRVLLSRKSSRASLNSHTHQLPFLADSTDLVVLHHSLDFESEPFSVLREATRVIIPNGNLIVIGFNPWSFWGLCKAILLRSRHAPWQSRFVSPYRLAEWLDILELDVVGCETAFFKPPIKNQGIQELFSWMDYFGQRWLPQQGGFYILVAKKRVSCITPIRLTQRRRRAQVLPITASGRVSNAVKKHAREFPDLQNGKDKPELS